jgi:hypothetical protein
MKHHDYIICEILAKHNVGVDIESISRELRLREKEERWDIHEVNCIVAGYVNLLAIQKKCCLDEIYPETACKSNGVISAGTGPFLMCPLYRKPNKEI